MHNSLQVLIMPDNKSWTAVGLEHAVFAWGDSLEDAIGRFSDNLWLELVQSAERGEPSLSAIPKAPDFYWERAKSAKLLADKIEVHPPAMTENSPLVSPDVVPELRAAVG